MIIAKNIPEYVDLLRENVFAGRTSSKGTFCRNCGTIVRNVTTKKKKIKCSNCGETLKLK